MQTFLVQDCGIEQHPAVINKVVPLTRTAHEWHQPVLELSDSALHAGKVVRAMWGVRAASKHAVALTAGRSTVRGTVRLCTAGTKVLTRMSIVFSAPVSPAVTVSCVADAPGTSSLSMVYNCGSVIFFNVSLVG